MFSEEKGVVSERFARTDRELELAFQFAINRSDSDMSLALCSEFERLRAAAHDTDNAENQIEILQNALFSFHKAKEWYYQYSEGSKIYFQDMFEHVYSFPDFCFSWEDILKDRMDSLTGR